jgi:hypothetical protein
VNLDPSELADQQRRSVDSFRLGSCTAHDEPRTRASSPTSSAASSPRFASALRLSRRAPILF